MNGYDFDKTIYGGDSTVDFYLFCVRRKPSILLQIPKQAMYVMLYLLHKIDKTRFKEGFFSFLRWVDNVDEYVEAFWQKNEVKIKAWYLNQKSNNDVIISASPDFLLNPIGDKLDVKIIATKVDKKTGVFISKNCYGEEKARRFKKEMNDKKLRAFYTDSWSDEPMMRIAEKVYLVKGMKVDRIIDGICYT